MWYSKLSDLYLTSEVLPPSGTDHRSSRTVQSCWLLHYAGSAAPTVLVWQTPLHCYYTPSQPCCPGSRTRFMHSFSPLQPISSLISICCHLTRLVSFPGKTRAARGLTSLDCFPQLLIVAVQASMTCNASDRTHKVDEGSGARNKERLLIMTGT